MLLLLAAGLAAALMVMQPWNSGEKEEPPMHETKSMSELHHIKCTHQICPLPHEHSLRFFAIGDWGGWPVPPYRTPAQWNVAKAMATIGSENRTHFQIGLGDNVYMVGVQEKQDGKLFRLHETFEKVYKNVGPLSNPWYIIAGNHDHYGSVDAQIAYTKTSNRWVFPKPNYVIRYKIANDVRIDIVMIDTIDLCGNTREGKYKNFYQYWKAPKSRRKAQGPEDIAKANATWLWIERQLSASKANYLFVAGHYPVYSIAEHGPTDCLVNVLQPMLHKYRVNAYLCGHDHDLQHLEETDDQGWTVLHVLSGAAAYEKKSNESAHLVPPGSSKYFFPEKERSDALGDRLDAMAARAGLGKGGFVYVEVGRKEAKFQYVIAPSDVRATFRSVPRN